MNRKNLNKYPVQIHYIEEDDSENYFFAYNPDFGASACSATGDTIPEAIANLANVRRDVIAYLREKKQPVPPPSPNPLEKHTKRCSQNCHHVDDYVECYGTVKCSIDKSYAKVGSPCRHPLEQFERNAVDNQWVCVHQCEAATILEYQKPKATFIKCGKDNQPRKPGTNCPHPGSVRKMKKQLDPVTKFYLRAIRKESKKITTTHTHDMVDELVAKALRLQETVSPVYKKHYCVIDSTNYAIRIGALALRLLTRNFYNKAMGKK